MAIHSYLADDTVQIHLTGDNDNPTWIHLHPMTGRAQSKWQALQAYALKKITAVMVNDTPDATVEVANRQVDEQVTFFCSRITKIENAYLSGELHKVIEPGNIMRSWIEGLLAANRDDLLGIMRDDLKIQELSFRGDPVPPAEGGEGGGESEGVQAA